MSRKKAEASKELAFAVNTNKMDPPPNTLYSFLFFFKRHLFSVMIRLLHLAINSMGAKKKH